MFYEIIDQFYPETQTILEIKKGRLKKESKKRRFFFTDSDFAFSHSSPLPSCFSLSFFLLFHFLSPLPFSSSSTNSLFSLSRLLALGSVFNFFFSFFRFSVLFVASEQLGVNFSLTLRLICHSGPLLPPVGWLVFHRHHQYLTSSYP